MSMERILALSIEGCEKFLASGSGVSGLYSGTSELVCLGTIPQGQTLSVSLDRGSLDAGGVSLKATDLSSILNQHTSGAEAIVAAAVSRTATTITVDSTSGYGSTIWVGREAMTVTGTTATTFTVTRAQLGTLSQRHPPGVRVYPFNPTIEGRRAVLEWVDPITLDRWTRFVGQIERVESQGDYTLTLTSLSVRTSDARVLGVPFGRGTLSHVWVGQGDALPAKSNVPFEISLESKDAPFSDPSGTGIDKCHLVIDDEVVAYDYIRYPKQEAVVQVVVSSTILEVSPSSYWRERDLVDIEDGSGNIVAEAVLVVGLTPSGSNLQLEFNRSLPAAVAVGYVVKANYAAVIGYRGMMRGAAGTPSVEHAIGATVEEARVIEGDQVDILYRLLASDQGDGTNGPSGGLYDVYPEGWGLALESSFFDTEALDALRRERSGLRLYIMREPILVSEFLAMLSATTNSSVYWSEAGVITAAIRRDVWPQDTNLHTITEALLLDGSVPSASIDFDRVKNLWVWRTDYDVNGDRPIHTITVQDVESRHLRGDRPVEPIEDKGLRKATGEAQLFSTVQSMVLLRSQPLLFVKVEVLMDPETIYRPGDPVALSVPHIPDLQGGAGLSFDLFEIVEIGPQDPTGFASLVLMQRRATRRLGYVAPCARVLSSSGSDVVVEPASSSHFSTPAPDAPDFLPASGEDGNEDSDWFLPQDPITLWDESTFGAASPTKATATISSINYTTRTLTLSSAVPAWLAPGDLVRLDYWAIVKAGGTAASRIDTFLALADSTASPPDLAGDDAYKWGI